MRGNSHVRFGERGGETRRLQSQKVRPAPTLRTATSLKVAAEEGRRFAGSDRDLAALESAAVRFRAAGMSFKTHWPLSVPGSEAPQAPLPAGAAIP